MVQAIAAEKGAAGLQQWMDKMGMGTDVMTAAEAQNKQEQKRAQLELEMARVVR